MSQALDFSRGTGCPGEYLVALDASQPAEQPAPESSSRQGEVAGSIAGRSVCRTRALGAMISPDHTEAGWTSATI